MSTHKPKTIEEWLQQMQEALQEVPQDVRLPGSLLGSNGGRPHAPLRQR